MVFAEGNSGDDDIAMGEKLSLPFRECLKRGRQARGVDLSAVRPAIKTPVITGNENLPQQVSVMILMIIMIVMKFMMIDRKRMIEVMTRIIIMLVMGKMNPHATD